MIPFGNVRAWTANGWTRFTPDEQFTLMSLWCIARSPLILGGNLPKNDDFTLSLLTNDEVLQVNQNSANNRQLFNTNNQVAWIADVPGSKDKYLAVFNTAPVRSNPPRRAPNRTVTVSSNEPTPKLLTATNAAGQTYTFLMGSNSMGGTVSGVRLLADSSVDTSEATRAVPIPVSLAELGINGSARVRDLWTHKDLGTMQGEFSPTINSHGAGLYRISPLP